MYKNGAGEDAEAGNKIFQQTFGRKDEKRESWLKALPLHQKANFRVEENFELLTFQQPPLTVTQGIIGYILRSIAGRKVTSHISE